MDADTDILELFGLVLVLMSGAIVFITVAQFLAGKRRSRIQLGTEMSAFFALLYAFHQPVLRFASFSEFSDDVARITATLFWLSAAFMTNAMVDRWIWHGALSRAGEPITPRLLRDFVAVFFYVSALMIVMHFVFGEPITAIAATSGAVAFIVGYSAQSTLGELFAGVSMQASKNIRKGDFVEIGDVYGYVYDMDWRSITVYQYITAALIVYPNSVLASQAFRNHSRPADPIRIPLRFTVEFSAPPSLVRRAVTEELLRGRIILKDPAPYVQSFGTNEYGLEYRALIFCSGDSDYFPAQDEAFDAIWVALRSNGLHAGMNHHFAGEGSRFDKNAWSERNVDLDGERAVVATCPIFEDLAAEERDELIAAARRLNFAPPEIISDIGEPGDTLLVIAQGHASADLAYDLEDENADPDEMFVANDLVPGEAIGLRSFLSGSPRAERVQCLDYTVVYVFDRDTLIPVLESHPQTRRTIENQIKERDLEADRRRKAHRVELARRARLSRKREIALGMTERLGGLIRGGLFGRSSAKKQIAEATMAAAALVAAADGVIEPEERDAVAATFREMDLFRFIDPDKGLAAFDRYCAFIGRDERMGTRAAFDAVKRVARNPAAATLVMDIAVAISAADGEVEEPEERRIAELREIIRRDVNTKAA